MYFLKILHIFTNSLLIFDYFCFFVKYFSIKMRLRTIYTQSLNIISICGYISIDNYYIYGKFKYIMKKWW